jgi:ABC-type Fe3+/spermidine/putrescine transport system ATPase subunit
MKRGSLLTVDDISFKYANGTTALEHVDLNIPAGSHFGVLGPNGCGKTTLLKIIGGHISPTSGKVYLEDVDITRLSPQKRSVTTVFQDLGLFPHLNVAENISFGIRCKGKVPRSGADAQAEQWMLQMSLDDVRTCKPHDLSTGRQQKVAITRALAVKPDLWLLDEPTSALDGIEKARLVETLNMAHEHSWYRAAMVVTHDLPFAFAVCDQIAVMNRGRIIQVGTPTELMDKPFDSWVAQYLGIYNVIDGQLQEDGSFCWLGSSIVSRTKRGQARGVTNHRLLIRIDNMSLAEDASFENILNCRIERVEPGLYGPVLRVIAGKATLRIKLSALHSVPTLQPGNPIRVGFNDQDIRLVDK